MNLLPLKKGANASSIRVGLTALVVGCILPLATTAAFLIFSFYQHEQTRLIDNAISQARATVATVDQGFFHIQSALQALSTSSGLDENDGHEFYSHALRTLRNIQADSIVLTDPDGKLIFSTYPPHGKTLPTWDATPLLERFKSIDQPSISDLYVAPLSKKLTYSVSVPIYRNGASSSLLYATVSPSQLLQVLEEQKFAPSWRAAVIDSNGNIVARTHDIEKFIGTKARPNLLQQVTISNEGSIRSRNLDGVPVITVYSRSAKTHWLVVIGIPLEEMTAGLRHTLTWLIVSTLAALIAGLLFARLIGGRIVSSIFSLIEPARAIGSNTRIEIVDSYFKETNQLGLALHEAARHLDHTQSNLYETDRRLSLAIDAAHLGIWTRDLATDEIQASGQWRSLFGFNPTQRIDFDDVLMRIHPDDQHMVMHALTYAPGNTNDYSMEFRIELPDSNPRWISSRGSFELDQTRRAIFSRGISYDITARKQVEFDLQQKKMEIMHLSRVTMLGELSGALAHELSQPLTSILSNAQAAQRYLNKDHPDLDEVRAILQDIVDEDKRAGEVILRLRDLLSPGKKQSQVVDITHLIAEVGKLLRNDLLNQGVELQIENMSTLTETYADAIQLQQVLINLIMNACDAMAAVAHDERKITIRIRQNNANHVHISVIDRGTGIHPDQLEKIFDAFYTTKARGMGLGLSICRNIVQANGGRLWAENVPGGGATFHFYVPQHVTQTL
jgi:signal transduction histidine kinase